MFYEFLEQTISLLGNLYFILGACFFYLTYFTINMLWNSNVSIVSSASNYAGKQRVHDGEVPRLGGLILFIYFAVLAFFSGTINYQEEQQLSIICLVPMMIVIVKEDLLHNVDYRLRFCALTLSVILLLTFAVDSFPVVENLYLITNLFEIPAFNFIFYALCLVGLANGFNFIDGMNGLLAFYTLGALVCCLQLAFFVGDHLMAQLIVLYLFATVCFTLLNFPFGKVFMGDAGAYMIGLLLGIWVIKFFATYDTISSWNAGLIFFYPIIEVTYSFIRKLIQHKSPFEPDREHLHLKVFDILNTATKKPKLSNNLTTVFVSLFWMAPPLLLPLVYDQQLLVFLALTLLSITYLTINFVVPEKTTYA